MKTLVHGQNTNRDKNITCNTSEALFNDDIRVSYSMKYFVIFPILLILIGFSFADAQYQGDIESYHLPVQVESESYSIITQSIMTEFIKTLYDEPAKALIFSISSDEQLIDTMAITMNNQTFLKLFPNIESKDPNDVFVLVNGEEIPYKAVTNSNIVSWVFMVPPKSTEIEIIGSPFYDSQIFKPKQLINMDNFSQIYSPLKQDHLDISFEKIQCKQNLMLVQKYDGTPACVTESTKQKLIERGWTKITSINLTFHDTQSWGYIKDISILDNDYVGITMSYPTNEAYHELYPDEHNSIIGNCEIQHDSAVLSILYLKDVNHDANTVTFTKESKNFDGMACNDAFWDEMTKYGYCGPPPHFMSQRETLTSSITDAQKMVDFPLEVPKYLPAGYNIQKISVDSDRDRATLFISPMPVTNETDMCKFAWVDEGIYLSYVSIPEDAPRFGNDPKKERITINENHGYVEHRWVGDRFGTPIPQRSEVTWHIPEGNLVLDMLSSLPSEELIKIAESLE